VIYVIITYRVLEDRGGQDVAEETKEASCREVRAIEACAERKSSLCTIPVQREMVRG
jgi:hypothetical protein